MNFKSLIVAIGLAALSMSAQAQTGSSLAVDGLQARIALLSDTDGGNPFELGMLQTLRGVEKSLQTRYRFGLGQRLTGIPLIRLSTSGQINPAPLPRQPDTISQMMAEFLSDMEHARDTLAQAETNGIAPFEIALTDIWFDVNANGTRDTGEDAIRILGGALLGERAFSQFQRDSLNIDTDFLGNPVSETYETDLTVRFDATDHAWLTAYTHMLSGVANLYLAFDPTPILRDLAVSQAQLANAPSIPSIYNQAGLAAEIQSLTQEEQDLRTQLTALREQSKALSEKLKDLRLSKDAPFFDEDLKQAISDEIDAVEEQVNSLREDQRAIRNALGFIRAEIRSAKSKQTGPTQRRDFIPGQQTLIDLVYVTLAAIQQQPDPDHIRAAHADWLAMIAHNRTFWARLAEETDNDREWIPNPQQDAVLPVDVPAPVAEGWQAILADAEALLEGNLLLPHPFLPAGHGISIPAYVENPVALDLTKWIHGTGAYPFVARGPMITAQRWQAFQRLTGGNAGGFALFLN